ncbi:alpha/beta fold hydrolase [Paracoccus seriniphilus]|uniref:Pimeloyl-ACP methyl ester carboxylesterase n=1 Tax=Paracoccus seriniphilus TaxID=184748 RepID=A0A239PMG5_9RHOB|nr:alpha/beta fold hydrolase [Paracoccus seriniphilus]WCR15051.1 alpha/beta fold hydrolase [Paracoccus seriniphilus]SNT71499.1 Pimeloyl-ACP methyl ester carboxylesterase [Paracoccus seriniphilus]
MTLLRLVPLVLMAALACGLLWKTLPARTSPVAGPDPIAELIAAEIGGMTQWLLIRGADRDAPILLWLHGGPGAAQMPAHGLTAALERDFVVVHWDQRGAGKSNPPSFDPATMTLERFLMDAREVTAILRERVGRQPLFVFGHSWGTMLGARLMARWPGEYAGYIGVSQQVDTLRGAALTRDWLQEVAPSDLARLDPQAFRDHDLYVRLMQEVEAQGGGMDVSLVSMMPRALAAPEYRLPDYWRWLDGANRGSGPMWDEYLVRDLIAEVPVMPVPMLLISGAQDWNTPVELVREWFAAVEAPQGKRMEVFDQSGHAPFLTETARFVDTVRGFAAEIEEIPE